MTVLSQINPPPPSVPPPGGRGKTSPSPPGEGSGWGRETVANYGNINSRYLSLHRLGVASSTLQQDRCNYLAVFAHQYVVGAAGGSGIHAFHADAGCGQLLVQVRTGKALLVAGAKQ